jgi:polyketide cyclase/dehydrase/lipid transport protein
MESIMQSITINRPIEEVFDVATCQERCVVWRGPITIAAKTSEGPVTVGTTYEHQVKFLGITLVARPIIRVWEPPYRAEFENNDGPVKYYLTFTCEAKNGGTLLTTIIKPEIHGAFKHIADEIVHQAIMRQHASDLETLKNLLESETLVAV